MKFLQRTRGSSLGSQSTSPDVLIPEVLGSEKFVLKGKNLSRDKWDRHTHMKNGRLPRFWLSVHDDIRAIGEQLVVVADIPAPTPVEFSEKVSTMFAVVGRYLQQLDMHEKLEVSNHFEDIRQAETAAAAALESLERDHESFEGKLESLAQLWESVVSEEAPAPDQLAAGPSDDASPTSEVTPSPVFEKGALLAEFSEQAKALVGLVNAHFIREEDIVIPILLKHKIDFHSLAL